MFKHTREAFNRLAKICSVVSWIFNYGMNILMIVYLTIAVIVPIGNLITNAILLAITALMLIVNIAFSKMEMDKYKGFKRLRKTTTHALSAGKLLVKAYSLGVTLYGMYIAASMVSPINVIVTTLLIITWIISVVVEIGKITLELVGRYILNSLKEDFKWFTDAKSNVEAKFEEGKVFVQEKYEQGKEFAQQKIEQGKEFAQEKLGQGKEYAQSVAEQGKTKLDEAKSAVQDFFKKSKKAE